MIKLETNFTNGDGGYSASPLTYVQIKRNDVAAIYKRNTKDGLFLDYEVFKILIEKEGKNTFGVITQEDTEKYPSTGKFGKTAWSVNSLERAQMYFDRITKDAASIVDESDSVEDANVSPANEFSTKEYAEANDIEYPVAFLAIKKGLEDGTIKYVRSERRNVKGKETKLYTKI